MKPYLLKAGFLALLLFSLSFSSEIKWLSFEEGIKKAQKGNKLIIMDIYAKWCHWCNVIENTTYRDKEVINLIGRYYIPVRVDAEKRPDLNKKYNQGGLPSTLILDKNGNILFGAIYVPPDEMKKLLITYAKMSPEEIKQEIERVQLEKSLKIKRIKRALKEKNINLEQIAKTYKYIKLIYDYENGGIKGAPKFPKINLPYFLMLYSLIFEDKQSKGLAIKTLKAYSNLIDKVEGGIFRYSVNEYWSEPHYEKLLKDQAQISILYFNGYSLYNKKEFLNYANNLISFSKNKLYNKETGYFYNSQGADIVDEEGTLLITGEEYFVKNKEGRKIIEQALGYSPNIEKSIYFGNNLLMADALIYSYIFNNEKEDFMIAERIIKNIIKEALKDKGVIHSKNIQDYYLSNQVYFLQALLDFYEITGDITYLQLCKKMFEILNKYYFSEKTNLYVDVGETGFNLENISFIDNIFDLNSQIVFQFYKLSSFTGNEKYFSKAIKILKKLPAKGNISTSNAYFVYFYPPLLSYIAGYKTDKEKFIKNLFKVFPYYHYTQFISKDNEKLLKKLGYSFEEKTIIYVCNNKICFKKLQSLQNLRKEILNLFKNYKKFNLF